MNFIDLQDFLEDQVNQAHQLIPKEERKETKREEQRERGAQGDRGTHTHTHIRWNSKEV